MFLYQVYALCVKLILPLLLIVFCSVIWLRNGGNKLCFGLILLILVKDLNKLDFGLLLCCVGGFGQKLVKSIILQIYAKGFKSGLG